MPLDQPRGLTIRQDQDKTKHSRTPQQGSSVRMCSATDDESRRFARSPDSSIWIKTQGDATEGRAHLTLLEAEIRTKCLRDGVMGWRMSRVGSVPGKSCRVEQRKDGRVRLDVGSSPSSRTYSVRILRSVYRLVGVSYRVKHTSRLCLSLGWGLSAWVLLR